MNKGGFPGNSGKRIKTFRDPGIWKKIFRDPGNFEKIFRDPGVWNVTGTGNLCNFFPGIGIFLLFLPGSGNFLKIFPGSVNLKDICHRSLASSNHSTQEKWWKHSVFISYNPSLHRSVYYNWFIDLYFNFVNIYGWCIKDYLSIYNKKQFSFFFTSYLN